MRRGTIVAGATAAVLAGGAATASAAPVPISVAITGGTVKAGSFASTATTGTGGFAGTIDSGTFAASFPTGNTLPSVTIPNVTVSALPPLIPLPLPLPPLYEGPLTITAAPGAFTGQGKASASGVSLDLTGPVAYTFKAGANTCVGSAPAVTLTGAPIDLASGAFSASGTTPTPVITTTSSFCLALAAQLPPVTSTIATSVSGKVTIPGLIPLPDVTVVPPVTTTPTTPTTPVVPTPVVKPGKLAVTVSKPKTVKRGSSTVTKVVVRNTGAGTARSVTVKLAASGKGVTPRSTSKTYSTIGVGKTRTFSVRLRTKKTSAKSSSVKVTATGASGLSASRSTTLRLR